MKYILPWVRRRTESDEVISSGASKRTCSIVVSITISSRTRVFEKQRVLARLTRVRRCKRAATAILRRPKRLTSAFASHSICSPRRRHFQLSRTRAVELLNASSDGAVPGDAARISARACPPACCNGLPPLRRPTDTPDIRTAERT